MEGPGEHSPGQQTHRGGFVSGKSTQGVRKHVDLRGSTVRALGKLWKFGEETDFQALRGKGKEKNHYQYKILPQLWQCIELYRNYTNSLFSGLLLLPLQVEREKVADATEL